MPTLAPEARRPRAVPRSLRACGAALAALLTLASSAPLPTPLAAQAVSPPTARQPRAAAPAATRWTAERARSWGDSVGWQVGANYVPSSAGNQLEMWQAATWDPTTIDRELGWAQSLGMNTMRVFLHDLAYRQDPQGFMRRLDQFLVIAERHRIRPMIVIFDAVWDPNARTGPQRRPRPHLHNSIWVQSPTGALLQDSTRWNRELGPYVTALFRRFGRDRRILAWDLYNEPDNINRPAYVAYEPVDKGALALGLLTRTFRWARAERPIQPLTVGPWYGDWSDTTKMAPVFRYALAQSDIITFHTYDEPDEVRRRIAALEPYGRPIICTEYMARPRGSTFQTILPLFAERKVGAMNWGFVNGRSQTIYPWDSWTQEYTAEPKVWFHDVFHTNGTPYDTTETALIRRLTSEARAGRQGATR